MRLAEELAEPQGVVLQLVVMDLNGRRADSDSSSRPANHRAFRDRRAASSGVEHLLELEADIAHADQRREDSQHVVGPLTDHVDRAFAWCVHTARRQKRLADGAYKHMIRDARINMIGEGADDVLRVSTALVGMRGVGLELEQVLNTMKKPLADLGKLGSFAGRKLECAVQLAGHQRPSPRAGERRPAARQARRRVRRAGRSRAPKIFAKGSSIASTSRPTLPTVQRAPTLALRAAAARQDAAAKAHTTRTQAQVPNRPLLSRDHQAPHPPHLDDLWMNDDEATSPLADAVLNRYRA